mgnify:CR=1 FL=1
MGNCSLENVGYFSNHKEQSESNYKYLLKDLKESILPKYKHRNLIKNIETLVNRIEKYREDNNIEFIEMYYLLLIWLHNIGECTGYKKDSPLISTTLSLDVAFSFHDKNSKVRYAFVALLSKDKKSDYFYTSRLNEILNKLGIEWHKDINEEVIFKDTIFPQLIIGILKKEDDDISFIINPWLIKFCDSQLPNDLKKDFLIKKTMKSIQLFCYTFRIPINQNEFDKGIKSLNYRGYVKQIAEARTISKDNIEFSVESIKDL